MVNGFFILHQPEVCMRNNKKIIKNGNLWNATRNSLDGLSELVKESAARREIFLIVACALVFGFMRIPLIFIIYRIVAQRFPVVNLWLTNRRGRAIVLFAPTITLMYIR